jgi:hypothetical protein
MLSAVSGLGGSGWSVEAKSTPPPPPPACSTGVPSGALSDGGGFLMSSSLMNVTAVRNTRITAAPTVHPISRRVLPWICAATVPLRARYLTRQ